jgi:hypothetical protein
LLGRNLYILYAIVLLFTGLSACKKKTDNQSQIIAEYKDKTLDINSIPKDLLQKFSTGDSVNLLKAYVDNWINNQILLDEADKYLNDEEKDKSTLINDYRNSLIIFEYHRKLMNSQLDTTVSEDEIKDYYENYINNFVLRKNIVKIKYIKIDENVADLKKLKNLMLKPSVENDLILKKYAEEKAQNFYLDTNWLYLDDITKEIPLSSDYNQQRFLSSNKFIQLAENNMLYLLYISDFRIKNNYSPIEFESENIKNIINYQRKLEFIKNHQTSLFNNATNKGEIKYHFKP